MAGFAAAAPFPAHLHGPAPLRPLRRSLGSGQRRTAVRRRSASGAVGAAAALERHRAAAAEETPKAAAGTAKTGGPPGAAQTGLRRARRSGMDGALRSGGGRPLLLRSDGPHRRWRRRRPGTAAAAAGASAETLYRRRRQLPAAAAAALRRRFRKTMGGDLAAAAAVGRRRPATAESWFTGAGHRRRRRRPTLPPLLGQRRLLDHRLPVAGAAGRSGAYGAAAGPGALQRPPLRASAQGRSGGRLLALLLLANHSGALPETGAGAAATSATEGSASALRRRTPAAPQRGQRLWRQRGELRQLGARHQRRRSLGGRWRHGRWRRRRPLWCHTPLQRLLARRRGRRRIPGATRRRSTVAGAPDPAAASGALGRRRRSLAAAALERRREPGTPWAATGAPLPVAPARRPAAPAAAPALALLGLRRSLEAAEAPTPAAETAVGSAAAALGRRSAAGGPRRWGPAATAAGPLLRSAERRQRPLAALQRCRSASGRRTLRSRFGEVRALETTSPYPPEAEELPLPELRRRVPGQRWLLPPEEPFAPEEPRWRSAEVAFDRERWHSAPVADYRQREYTYRLQCGYRVPGFLRSSRRGQRSPLRWGLSQLPRQRLPYALAAMLLGASVALAPLATVASAAANSAEEAAAEASAAEDSPEVPVEFWVEFSAESSAKGSTEATEGAEGAEGAGAAARGGTPHPTFDPTTRDPAADLRSLALLAGRRPAAAALEETGFLPSHRYGRLGAPERWWQERPRDPYAWLLEEGGWQLHAPLARSHWGRLRVEPHPSAAAAYRPFGAQRRLRRTLEGLTLSLILSPRRNNLYLVLQPQRFRRKPGERLFGRSAGELSKFKGFRRRSSANRRELYRLAAFRLLRHHKRDRRFRFLRVVLKGFLETLPRRLSSPDQTQRHLRSLLHPFLRRQLALRYPIISLQAHQGYAQQKRGYPHRSRKHKGAAKKKTL